MHCQTKSKLLKFKIKIKFEGHVFTLIYSKIRQKIYLFYVYSLW